MSYYYTEYFTATEWTIEQAIESAHHKANTWLREHPQVSVISHSFTVIAVGDKFTATLSYVY